MTNPFFSNTIDLLPATKARAGDVEANLTAVEAGFDEAKQYFDRTLRGARANPAISEIPDASTRANKALTFDGSGNPVATVTTTEISNAQTYANNAQASATAASGSASAAAGSAASAATLLDAFDDRYLGSKSSDPTLDNDGNALLTGALYWNTVSNLIRVYSGTAWQDLQQASAFFAQAFSGNGSTTAFTLSSAPASSASVEVFITGVRQAPATNYTVSGTTLTFVVAPPAGTNNVFVRWISVQTMTNGELTGNLNFSGTGLRLTGDFSNATLANRLMFQTSTANTSTIVQAIPSGTGTTARWNLANASDPDNASEASFAITSTLMRVESALRGTGTYLPMTFYTGGSERLRIDTSGNVGVGTSLPTVASGTGVAVYSASVARVQLRNATTGDASGDGCGLFASGTDMGVENRENGSTIFYTNNAERARIDSSGNVLVTGSGGLGYGTGSGGTVTQATSKNTAVTLNKPTGKITMNNAALGAGASVVFTVNNTLAQNNDLIVVNTDSTGGFTPDTYRVEARASVNAFAIKVTNTSGGSLSEAVVINFAIIKGATS